MIAGQHVYAIHYAGTANGDLSVCCTAISAESVKLPVNIESGLFGVGAESHRERPQKGVRCALGLVTLSCSFELPLVW